MNRACEIVVEGRLHNIQSTSSDHIAGQMENDLGPYGSKQRSYRGAVPAVGLPPLKMSVHGAVQSSGDCVYLGAARRESTAQMRAYEAAGARDQHRTPRNSIHTFHHFVPIELHVRQDALIPPRSQLDSRSPRRILVTSLELQFLSSWQ